jgi:UDP-glucuronate 4-epimerase
MTRDFTFVKDIVESVIRLIIKPAKPNLNWNGNNPEINTSTAPYQIFNVGNSSPIKLMEYIEALEFAIGIKAKKNFLPMQDGDVPATHADATALEEYIKYKPGTKIEDGISEFVQWYKKYYKVS